MQNRLVLLFPQVRGGTGGGGGGLWVNSLNFMVIGLRYSEKLNYSDKRYRYLSFL
jgi:hypothetical protein